MTSYRPVWAVSLKLAVPAVEYFPEIACGNAEPFSDASLRLTNCSTLPEFLQRLLGDFGSAVVFATAFVVTTATLLIAVFHVLLLGAKKKVVRVAATWVVATVAHTEARWNRPIVKLPSQPCCALVAILDLKPTIAVARDTCTCPIPAIAVVLGRGYATEEPADLVGVEFYVPACEHGPNYANV